MEEVPEVDQHFVGFVDKVNSSKGALLKFLLKN